MEKKFTKKRPHKTRTELFILKKNPIKLPAVVRIGGASDGEVDDAADAGLEDSGVPEAVASPERVEFDSVSWRKGPLELEKSGGAVDHRQRRQRDGRRQDREIGGGWHSPVAAV